jgi:hypothetical protein
MKKIAVFVMLVFFVFTLAAQEAEQDNGMTTSDALVLQITTLPEAKLTYTKHFKFPFLQGGNPLTSGNNIDFALSAEITPISLYGLAEAVWTPIAFFNLSAGGMIGSAWNMELFGSPLRGIGINQLGTNGKEAHEGNGFDGAHWKAQAGATVQMDMAAIFPGDWNHVVMQSYHEINYKAYTAAKEGESWYFQSDAGENQNGFNYYGNLLLGYQMPIFLNTVGLMAEADLYLYDTPNSKQWGGDKIRWTFSGAANFTITEQLGASLILQLRTRRNFDEGKESDKDVKELYYRTLDLKNSDPLYLEFYRVALGLTYTF